MGAEFYESEEDYIPDWEVSRRRYQKLKSRGRTSISHPQVSVLIDRSQAASSSSASSSSSFPSSSSTKRGTKRPRRTAATVQSYFVPDSDDEVIENDSDVDVEMEKEQDEYKKKSENVHLHKWIKHLGDLLKEEQAKVSCCQQVGTKRTQLAIESAD